MTFTKEDVKRLADLAHALLTTRRQLEILQETLRQVDAIALSNPAGYYEPGEYDRNDERPEDMTAFNASEIHTIILEALESIKKVGES